MKTGKTVKVLLALTTAAGMLAGCGSKTDTDTFRFANDTDIVGMDSTVVDDAMSFNAITAITDGLTTVDVKGNTIPGIAKSWDVSNNGLTYTFHLRDAKWANGDDVTAQDFVYSWHRIIKNAGNYAYMLGSEGASIKNADSLINLGTAATDEQLNTLGIKATDDKTVVVDLEKNVPYFVGLMSFPCYFPQNQKFVEKCGKKYATKPEYILGNGDTVIAQYPVENSYISSGQKVFLVTDTNNFIMPDLTGWTRKEVTALWSVTQFGFKLEGEGVVKSQNIAPGTPVTKGTEIEVVFE